MTMSENSLACVKTAIALYSYAKLAQQNYKYITTLLSDLLQYYEDTVYVKVYERVHHLIENQIRVYLFLKYYSRVF